MTHPYSPVPGNAAELMALRTYGDTAAIFANDHPVQKTLSAQDALALLQHRINFPEPPPKPPKKYNQSDTFRGRLGQELRHLSPLDVLVGVVGISGKIVRKAVESWPRTRWGNIALIGSLAIGSQVGLNYVAPADVSHGVDTCSDATHQRVQIGTGGLRGDIRRIGWLMPLSQDDTTLDSLTQDVNKQLQKRQIDGNFSTTQISTLNPNLVNPLKPTDITARRTQCVRLP